MGNNSLSNLNKNMETPLAASQDLVSFIQNWAQELWFQINSWGFLYQVIAVVTIIILGIIISRFALAHLKKVTEERPNIGYLQNLKYFAVKSGWAIASVILLWITEAAFAALNQPHGFLRIVAGLLNAWIIVNLVASVMKPGFWSKLFVLFTWTVAALYILRLLDPVVTFLDSLAINVGDFHLSLLRVITSAFAVGFALWLGRMAGDAAQNQLRTSSALTPSMAGLLGQVAKIGFMVIAVVFALYSVGINLTALTVFSGALGVGIGFGLQAIFSNFISGIIILMEKSVKVGDFIELQSGVTGLVSEINIRSTIVTTNDNVDILVPNEEFIKSQVINWTLRESRRRLHVPFGVAYGTDKELVKKAALEAADEVPWTFDKTPDRKPQVWLTEFGDSSINYELVVWLTEEAVKKPARVLADFNWALHTALYKYELEIPFPQRDLNIRQPAELRVHIANGDEAKGKTTKNHLFITLRTYALENEPHMMVFFFHP